jgi:hypothetical protein
MARHWQVRRGFERPVALSGFASTPWPVPSDSPGSAARGVSLEKVSCLG